jgi:hypothetical protein
MSAAWVGLIGTAVGVVLGGGISALIDRARWRREQRVRWHDDRRRVYARLLLVADEYKSETGRLIMARLAESEATRTEAFAQLGELQDTMRSLVYEVRLLAAAEVREATDRLDNALVELFSAQFGVTPRNVDEPARRSQQEKAWREYHAAFEDLQAAARREIGLD